MQSPPVAKPTIFYISYNNQIREPIKKFMPDHLGFYENAGTFKQAQPYDPKVLKE